MPIVDLLKQPHRLCSTVKLVSNETESKELYSSLYISNRDNQKVTSVLKPTFDVSYLVHVQKNLDHYRTLFDKRKILINFCENEIKQSLCDFTENFIQINSLKNRLDKLRKKLHKKNDPNLQLKYSQIIDELNLVRKVFFELEDKVAPFLLSLPNDIRSDIQSLPQIIDEFDGEENADLGQYAALSYVRLGYINNIHNASIVGPNAKYFMGEGAQMYHAIIELASQQLESSQFCQINGLDIVKSALVEAVNLKNFKTNSYRLRLSANDDEENQRLHIVGEASLESLCAILAKNQLEANKFFQIGSSYHAKSVSQTPQIRATVLCEPNESNNEMEHLYRLVWQVLTQIGVKCQSRKCAIESLNQCEYAMYELYAYLHSQRDWLRVGQVCHYTDYVTRRLGMKSQNIHMVSSHLDLFELLHCIMEHFQDVKTGRIARPSNLKSYFYL